MPATRSEKVKNYKMILFALGITETLLGCVSMVVGIVLAVNLVKFSFFLPLTFVEGVWCGVWILVAGVLGIVISRKESLNSCMINCHMGFAITAAVFAVVQIALASLLTTFLWNLSTLNSNLTMVLAIVGFVSFIVCIVSASFCCPLHTAGMGRLSCCGACCCDEESAQHQKTGTPNVAFVQ